jgi:hypothetical protein
MMRLVSEDKIFSEVVSLSIFVFLKCSIFSFKKIAIKETLNITNNTLKKILDGQYGKDLKLKKLIIEGMLK